MACTLVLSRPLACKDGVGGVAEIKFHALPTSLSNYTLTSGVVTIAGSDLAEWFKYNLEKETASATFKYTSNAQNGTSFWDLALTIILNKTDTALANEIKSIGQSRLQVAVKFQDGTYWLFGYQNGMDLTTADGASGTAFGDRNGFVLNFIGKEQEFPNMSSATYDTL